MIALPNYLLSSKIATPNKVPALKGVSPISSSRNIMVKVKDTASFIEAARAVHGDKYDYSSTDYIGANMPIQIICKTHGLFTCGWAASHYTKKGSGCQKCSGCEAKVKDTFSFVEVSKQIYGNKYDYSLSMYEGCKKPITIICRKCGPFTLSEAQSHYGNKKCGCKQCTTEKRKLGEIGVPLKTKVCECGFKGLRRDFKSDSNVCKSCHKKQRQEKYTVKCKGCEKQISTSLNRPFCSSECRAKSLKSKLIQTECCNCGKSITKRSYRDTDKFCCSIKCQHEWSFVKNHSTASENAKDRIDWRSRSKHAKSQWIKKRRKERLQSSVYGEWLRKASQQRIIFNNKEESPWKRRCASARSMLSERLEPAAKKEKAFVITDWVKACDKSHKRFLEKVKRSNASPWMKKITIVESSMRKRRQLRNAKQSTLSCS